MNSAKPSWAIFNREGSRLLQFGNAGSEDEAMRLLKRAQSKYPDAGCHLKRIDKFVS